jgi:UDP-glucuronate 4-epimerase
VYGNSLDAPFNENNITDKPISLYAATKRSNELIAYAYSHIHNFKVTGLRFFTVYGPWGRPDMAPYIFVDKIAKGKEITVYNNGNMIRDFTYVDDIVSGIVKLSHNNKTKYNYKIYNIGNSKPIILNEFIKVIEKKLNKRAIIRYDNVRKGDVLKTHADITSITNDTEYNPSTNVEDGMSIFIDWMKRYNLI